MSWLFGLDKNKQGFPVEAPQVFFVNIHLNPLTLNSSVSGYLFVLHVPKVERQQFCFSVLV